MLEWCPLLQDYANVSYTKVNNDVLKKSEEGQNEKDIKPVEIISDDDIYQYENIYEPEWQSRCGLISYIYNRYIYKYNICYIIVPDGVSMGFSTNWKTHPYIACCSIYYKEWEKG